MTTVKQILDWPVGYQSGGFVLTVKTAKKITKVNDQHFQDVMFTEGNDEIWGKLKLPNNVPIQRQTPIRIIVGFRVVYNINNKDVPALYAEEWADARPSITVDEWENEQNEMADEWKKAQDERIRGMCRNGLVKEYRRLKGFEEPLDEGIKELINRDVDFIISGQ